MFDAIFKETLQGWKHPRSWTFAEPDLLSYRKHKRVVQNEMNDHYNSNNSQKYHDENRDERELYQGNSKRSTQ